MSNWQSLSRQEVREFVEGKLSYKFEAHQFTGKLPKCSWPYCVECGLIALKNNLTRKAVALGCQYQAHSSWQGLIKSLGGLLLTSNYACQCPKCKLGLQAHLLTDYSKTA